jgi:hypothetical protein
MNPTGSMDKALRATAVRRRFLRGWEGFWRGVVAGGIVFAVGVAVMKLFPLPKVLWWWTAGAASAAVAAGFVHGFWRSISRAEAARWLDAKKGLSERLATAVEVGSAPVARSSSEETWRQLVMRDAELAAGSLDPRKLAPLTVPRTARAAALTTAVAAGLCFVPAYRSPAMKQKEADKVAMKDIGKNLEDLVKKELQRRPPALETSKKALEEVKEIGQKLQQAKLTRDEALKDLAKVNDHLQQQAEELAKNPALQKLAEAARTPDGASNPDMEALQKKIESMQQQLGKAVEHPDVLDKLQAKMDKLKAAAQAAMAGPPGAAQQAQSQLSQMASQLAKEAEAAGIPLPSLDEAVAALQNAQVEQFLRDLNVADLDLKKLAETAKMLSKLQQQAEKLGKDLAEQLKNGQAQAAIDTLEKMKMDVVKMDLSKEQIDKLASELERAEPNAVFSRELAKALGQASKAAGKGDKKAAAKAMAEAQDELKKLMNEMSDAESLLAEMKNLDKAGMCMGNGQCWGAGQSLAVKSGKGSKGGRGVGTWSENSAWAMPDHIDDLWDNSGLPARDQAGRGQTERDKTLGNNFSPTKVKGQMQPGAPMPSITLKGLSLKGDSKVQYTQAEAAAQEAGQSAQNQDQVPKAYRSAVRDYFDDSKK